MSEGKRNRPSREELLTLDDIEKIRRFDAMVKVSFSHINGEDLLGQLIPRKIIDIKHRVDGVDTWFEGDWLSYLFEARNGKRS